MEDDIVVTNSPTYQRILDKYNNIIQKLLHFYYESILQQGQPIRGHIKDIFEKINQLEQKQLIENPDMLIESIKEIFDKIGKISGEICQQLYQRENNLKGNYDEIQLKLEQENRDFLKQVEKQKIQNEIINSKYETIKKSIIYLEQKSEQQNQVIRQQKKEYDNLFKQKEQEIINLTKRKEKQLTKISILKGNQHRPDEQQQQLQIEVNMQQSYVDMPKIRPQTVSSQQFHDLKQSLQKVSIDPKKDDIKFQKQLTGLNQQKNMDQQKFIYQINKLEYQVVQRDKVIASLRKNLDLYHEQLREIKEKQNEEEKQILTYEANSEKNPKLIEYYKQKLEEKEKIIKSLNKSQRKFAILEKKLLVKEKAFEFERADYHEKVLFYSERCNKLSKLLVEQQKQQSHNKYGSYQIHNQENPENA